MPNAENEPHRGDIEPPRSSSTGGHPSMPIPSMSRRLVRSVGEQGEVIDGITYKRCNIINFDGRQYIFSHRAILTVVTVSTCNAACKFCSNEITFTPPGRFLKWNDKLQRAKDFALLGGVTKVAFTGGEPTLNPAALLALVGEMAPGFKKARLHTNGWGLHKTVSRADTTILLDGLIDRGLTGASISVAHFDPKINKDIMVLPKSWDGMSEAALADVAAHASPHFTPRLSCVMTADGINSTNEIMQYINWGRSLGFRRFIFRLCTEIEEGFKKDTSFTRYNDTNHGDVDYISRELLARSDIDLIFRQRKSDSKVDVFRMGDIQFDLDASSEENDPDPKIRRLNVMSNSVVHTSWIDPYSVLFADDYEIALKSAERELGGTQLPTPRVKPTTL